ncbi:hypothetical protein VTJ49DRAFT_2279 [Mycothermus thermophilus]|uniref:Inner centromere protein ARK-binding domain-containing protein n=1 Tax=Humicola insolens TaxID=85995 RepID=A0ABR3VAF8_HUMIN
MAPKGQCKIDLVEAPKSIQHIMAQNKAALEVGIVGRPMTTKQIQREYRKRTKTKKMTREEEREWQQRIRRELEEEERKRKEEDERERRLKRARTLRERKKAREMEIEQEKKRQGIPLVKVTASQNLITNFIRGKGKNKEDAAGVNADSPTVIDANDEPRSAPNKHDEADTPESIANTQSHQRRRTRASLLQLREKRDAEAADLDLPAIKENDEKQESAPAGEQPKDKDDQPKPIANTDRRKRRRLVGGIRWVYLDEPEKNAAQPAITEKPNVQESAVPNKTEEEQGSQNANPPARSRRLVRGSEFNKKQYPEEPPASLVLIKKEPEEEMSAGPGTYMGNKEQEATASPPAPGRRRLVRASELRRDDAEDQNKNKPTETIATSPPRRSKRLAQVSEQQPDSTEEPAPSRQSHGDDKKATSNEAKLATSRQKNTVAWAGHEETVILATSSPSDQTPIELADDMISMSTIRSSSKKSTQPDKISPVQSQRPEYKSSLSSPKKPRERPAPEKFKRPASEAAPEGSNKPPFLLSHRRSASSEKQPSQHAAIAKKQSPERRLEEIESEEPAHPTKQQSDFDSAFPTSTQLFVMTHLDDFFPSASQEARELAGEFPEAIPESPPVPKVVPLAKSQVSRPAPVIPGSPKSSATRASAQPKQLPKPRPPNPQPPKPQTPTPQPPKPAPTRSTAVVNAAKTRQAPPAQPALSVRPALTTKPHIPYNPPKPAMTTSAVSFDLPPISTQDLFLSSQDLREIEEPTPYKAASKTAEAKGGRWSKPVPLGRQLAQNRAAAVVVLHVSQARVNAGPTLAKERRKEHEGAVMKVSEGNTDKENIRPGRECREFTSSQEEYEDPELDRIIFKGVDLDF